MYVNKQIQNVSPYRMFTERLSLQVIVLSLGPQVILILWSKRIRPFWMLQAWLAGCCFLASTELCCLSQDKGAQEMQLLCPSARAAHISWLGPRERERTGQSTAGRQARVEWGVKNRFYNTQSNGLVLSVGIKTAPRPHCCNSQQGRMRGIGPILWDQVIGKHFSWLPVLWNYFQVLSSNVKYNRVCKMRIKYDLRIFLAL